jgi:hypothetical protein
MLGRAPDQSWRGPTSCRAGVSPTSCDVDPLDVGQWPSCAADGQQAAAHGGGTN